MPGGGHYRLDQSEATFEPLVRADAGVDAALLETDGETITAAGASLTLPYPAALRADLRKLLDRAGELPAHDPALQDATHRLTQHHADAVHALNTPADMIGFHGQTILHRPQQRRTWQIGDAPLLARLTGLPAYSCASRSMSLRRRSPFSVPFLL